MSSLAANAIRARARAARARLLQASLAVGLVFGSLACSALAQPQPQPSPSTAADAPLALVPGAPPRSLSPAVRLLGDPGERLDLQAARSALASGLFRPLEHPASNFGYVDGALWLHARVRNEGNAAHEWLLAVEYPLLDDLRVHAVYADGRVVERIGGDQLPFAARDLDLRFFNFLLTLPPGEPVDLFVRARSASSMQVPMVLATPGAYAEQRQHLDTGIGIYYGILVGLMLYNLVLWLSVRDRVFLWYVVYVASYGAMVLVLNGLAFQYLWPGSPRVANAAVVVGIPLAMLAMLQFSRTFLELRRHLPRGDAFLRALMLVAATLGVLALFLPYRPVVHAETLLVFFLSPAIFACAVLCWRRYPPARFFLLAWSMLLAGTLVFAAVSLGLLPKNLFTEYGMQIGSAAELILLSFALAYRINVLKADNERIQREAREQLEARVRARTAELDATLRRLEDANRKLEDFSRRDGLTGVYNRRHLDALLMAALSELRERRQPLSLLMVDVDHFKQVNDRHGHLGGDDCLRAVSDRIRALLAEERAALARYGGEEFVVILPAAPRDHALRVAERLRAGIAGEPVQLDGAEAHITISVGVHTVEGSAGCGAAELLRLVDGALYDAKNSGRNRVCAAPLQPVTADQ